jgi:hypothetical protein
MSSEEGRISRLRQEPLAAAPFWVLLLLLWGVLELGWRWRRIRARIS